MLNVKPLYRCTVLLLSQLSTHHVYSQVLMIPKEQTSLERHEHGYLAQGRSQQGVDPDMTFSGGEGGAVGVAAIWESMNIEG